MKGDVHLFKGDLEWLDSWVDPDDTPIMNPYLQLKLNKENSITLTMLHKEDVEKLLGAAKEVLSDHSKANELMPKIISYLIKEEAAYNDAYFAEVQDLANQLEADLNNTDWTNNEIWLLYEEPEKEKRRL